MPPLNVNIAVTGTESVGALHAAKFTTLKGAELTVVTGQQVRRVP